MMDECRIVRICFWRGLGRGERAERYGGLRLLLCEIDRYVNVEVKVERRVCVDREEGWSWVAGLQVSDCSLVLHFRFSGG